MRRTLDAHRRSAPSSRFRFLVGFIINTFEFEVLTMDNCGTSIQMVEQHSGRYLRSDFLSPLIKAGAIEQQPGKAEEHRTIRAVGEALTE